MLRLRARRASRLARERSLSSAWSLPGSNRRPPACKAGALPTELRPRVFRMVAMPSSAAQPSDLGGERMADSATADRGDTDEERPEEGGESGDGGPDLAEVSNWEIVTHYFDDAAERLDMADEVAAVLKSSYREVQVQIPVLRDD